MDFSMKKIINFLNDDTGAALAEYALLLAFIAAVCVVAVSTLGKNVSAMINSGAEKFPTTP
jgi:Flp pilus assembly pilin Flp